MPRRKKQVEISSPRIHNQLRDRYLFYFVYIHNRIGVFMNALEATVEIVKAAVASTDSGTYTILTEDVTRAKFLRGIDELYKKIVKMQEPPAA